SILLLRNRVQSALPPAACACSALLSMRRCASALAFDHSQLRASFPTHAPSHALHPTCRPSSIADAASLRLSPRKGDNSSPADANNSNDNSNSSNNSSNNNSDDNSSSSKPPSDDDSSSSRPKSSLDTSSVPKDYPQILALPLTRRPLFPGLYKSLYIKDPQVIAAIQSLVDRRQPYAGFFLSKDDNSDSDVVSDLSQVHQTGIFAQITNIYQAGMDNKALTIVVYPHRRIRITELLPSGPVIANTPLLASSNESVVDPVKNDAEVDSKKVDEANVLVDVLPAVTDQKVLTKEESDKVLKNKLGYLPVNDHLTKFKVSVVNIENLRDQPYVPENPMIKAITSEMLNVLKEISTINPLLRDQIVSFSIQTGGNAFADPAKLADFAAAVSSGEPMEMQGVLEEEDVADRLHKALVLLKKELANAKLQQEIAKEVDKKITRKQQEYFLTEQLKGIKKELGIDTDGKEKLIEKFKDRAKNLKMPEAVNKVFEEELSKLQHLESAASEFNVTRNYLDWLTQIPWGKHSKEKFHIKSAMKILDEDHYGLKDVKDRILEFIAVGKLRGTVEGKIICFVGPPGVGKTSVGKSIARALGREFFRFSVGGLSDVAEIKGHRRTYVGAMPGKVVQALKKVQTENPLIMIDEIDKLGRGHQGDPASALLELLDPEQNSSFLDHYMDVPIDLSKVLFVCTANVLDTIPPPLRDRMEVITLSGYVAEEKLAITKQYLAPVAMAAAGLTNWHVNLTDEVIETLIRNYCRESGVRNLKKQVEKIFRKVAYEIVKDDPTDDVETAVEDSVEAGETSESNDFEKTGDTSRVDANVVDPCQSTFHLEIKPENLKNYVGSPLYTSDRMYETTPVGVVMGLAWTSMGGTSLYIESVLESAITDNSRPGFQRTGQLGNVMNESANIAYTYARSYVLKKFPKNKFFDKASVHMHVPEGPSAGCTITTSLLSLALDYPVPINLAMTGEITLTGKILKIGGVKEKTIAAKRSGVSLIIFPKANQADWDELPDFIKEGLKPVFVDWYDDIFAVVFKDYKEVEVVESGKDTVKDEGLDLEK
ncbi:ATP-dependent Lon protease pim1, partial [Nowakowskiella sp. JEL0078]